MTLTENTGGDAPPAVTVVEFTDSTAIGESFEVLDQDVVQLETKPLRAKRVIVRLGRSFVVYQTTNLSVRARTRINDDLIGFVVFGPQSEGTFNGVSVRPDLLLAAEPGIAGEFVVQADYESFSVFLSPSELSRHFEIRQCGDEFRVPRGVEILQANVATTRSLFDWGKAIAETASRQPELFDDYQTSRETAHFELLELLLAAIDSTTDYEPTQKDQTRQSHARIVQIAEDFATSHTDKRVSMTDLCEAASVSERTLQYAFQDVMSMTPVAYLTRLRLHRVRQGLRAAGATSVSAEALQWGFWHFGDFSSAYKNCFGESPKDTLKRGGGNNIGLG